MCETGSEPSLPVNGPGKSSLGRQSQWFVGQGGLHLDTDISYRSIERGASK